VFILAQVLSNTSSFLILTMLERLKNYLKTPKGFGQFIHLLSVISPAKAAEIAFRVFCTPRKGRTFNKGQSKIIEKAAQERLPLHDFELQTYVWDSGAEAEKVLLVHGWDSNATRWRPVISMLLAEKYTVISFDAPAHGRSGSETINGVLYAQALEQVAQRFQPDYVVGHSFGGFAAGHYFANFDAVPIKRLILMATPSKLSRILQDYYTLINFKKRGQKAVDKYFRQAFGKDISYFSIEDFMKKVKIPGLVIHDREDETTPFQEGKAIHDNWQGSELFVAEGAGHSLQIREVYKQILEEIQKGGA
jgi:pimeloyl-ACP methyl ester carboxylesterase